MATQPGIDEASGSLAELFREATRVAVLTGAGASVASGVPTYRGAGGSWTRYDPNRYASITGFRQDPHYYWSFFRDERLPTLTRAEPNAAHHALAQLERHGKLHAVVTQNIDGLHQRAGSVRVLELHGSTRRFCCEACRAVHGLQPVAERVSEGIPPTCPSCNQPSLRPDVVFFGESLSPQVLADASDEMDAADLALVVGSSLVVQPAASLPMRTVQAGGALAILNMDPTPLDSTAKLLIRHAADEVLPRVVEKLGT